MGLKWLNHQTKFEWCCHQQLVGETAKIIKHDKQSILIIGKIVDCEIVTKEKRHFSPPEQNPWSYSQQMDDPNADIGTARPGGEKKLPKLVTPKCPSLSCVYENFWMLVKQGHKPAIILDGIYIILYPFMVPLGMVGPIWGPIAEPQAPLRTRWCYTSGRRWWHSPSVRHRAWRGSGSVGSAETPQLKKHVGTVVQRKAKILKWKCRKLSQAKSQDKNNIIHTIYKPPMLNGFFPLLHLRSSSSTRMFITSW